MQETAAQEQARQEVEESLRRSRRIIDMRWVELGYVALTGALVGVLTWVVAIILQNMLVEPLFCRPAANAAVCADPIGNLAFGVAAILTAVAGLGVLVRFSAYRPLIIVLAVVATLWNAQSWLGGLPWFMSAGWLALFYALSYTLYAWVVRIYNLPLMAAAVVLLVIGARLVIMR